MKIADTDPWWKHPDYAVEFARRMRMLDWMREEPGRLEEITAYYAAGNYADFVSDWGVTYDPRNLEVGLPAVIPFVLFEKQRAWIDWVVDRWRKREPGLCEKSRDMGISWTAIGLSCTLCIFMRGMSIGFGSRKAEYVDKLGEMKSLLPKARMFVEHLPWEFRAGYVGWRDAPQMRISFPDTGSVIGGEGGDDIGRGDRRSLYFVDEFAHFERPDLIEASLSQTTNCRIDMSSVRGMNNAFARKRWSGKVDVFIFGWRDDPRKDQAWYDKQVAELDPVVVAQEIDRDYQASVEGVVIPGAWVRAAIGAREKLGIALSGPIDLALDVADEGRDKNAMCGGQGIEISIAEEWSGKGSDTFHTVERAFTLADEHGVRRFRYDADGMGALVRGDARIVNERRQANNGRPIQVIAFRGSEGVFNPDGVVEGTSAGDDARGRTNQDYFQNRKAQGWWRLRKKFQKTHRWVVDGIPCAPDEIISIAPKLPNLHKLVTELSQPTYGPSAVGKMLIKKTPDGMPSPNLADGVMMRYAEIDAAPMVFTREAIEQIKKSGRRR